MFKLISSLFKFATKALKKLGGRKNPLKKGTSGGLLTGYIYTYDKNVRACDGCKPRHGSKMRVNADGTKKVLKEPFAIPPKQTHPGCDCFLRSKKIEG